MVEVRGVISNVIAVGTAGYRLYKVLSDLSISVGVARKDMANEVRLTSDVLLLIQESLNLT
jgi:hypothetical protein